MSAAAAAPEGDAAPKKKGSKKMLILIMIVVLFLVAAGGGAFLFMKKKKAADAEAEDGTGDETAAVEHATDDHAKPDISHPPTFVPLENFTVNLADPNAERYAQIGVTLQVDDPKFAESMKGFMPAIRNNILMILAHKTSDELLKREGKEALAEEIMREAVRPMGIEIDPEDSSHDEAAAGTEKKKKKKKKVHNPVTQVQFSTFIIQ